MINFEKKGFTIIEVLVVIVIIGLVMVVGSVRYREFSQRQTVVSAKRQILADIRAAQSDAASGRKPDGCTANHTLTGYGFEVIGTANPASYRTYAVCALGGVSANYVTKQTNLPQGVTITQPPVIIFKPLAEGTNIPSGTSRVITINTGVNSDTVTVTSAGEIK